MSIARGTATVNGTVARPSSSQLIWQETQHQRLFELLEALAFPERAPHFRAHEKFRAHLQR